MVETQQTLTADVQKQLESLLIASEKPLFGVNIDSRMNYIDSQLDDLSVFATLRLLRWPDKIICPRCHSSRVVLCNPPEEEKIKAQAYYKCLNCQDEARESLFNDLTNLEIDENAAPLRDWILCWYLNHFCPIGVISGYTGLSHNLVNQIIQLTHHLEIEQREQEEQRLKLELLLKKQQERYQETFDEETLSPPLKLRETGGVFLREVEDIKIAKERDKIHGGAPIMTKRF